MTSILKKLGAFSIGPIVSAFLGFITVPLITNFITTDEYGRCSMFTLAQSAAALSIYLGLDQAFVREFHSFSDKIEHLMANVIRIPLCMVLFIDIVILCIPSRISMILFDTPNEHLAVYLLALMLPCMVFENFGLLKIRMEERGLQYSFFVILLKALTLVFTVLLFLSYEKSYRSAVYAIAAAEIITGLALFFATMRHVPLLTEPIDRVLMERMLRFGLPLLPATMLGWGLTSMDKVMLRTMCNYSELGLYSAAYKIVNVLGVVQSCFTLYWVPLAFRWYGEQRLDGYSGRHGLEAGILAYLAFGGATGTSKDGLAETMLAFATERGTLQPGMPVVEASSGSFGAALAVSCATTGHPCILVVPSNLPIAQRKRLQDLGAHIIACSSSGRRAMERVAEDTAKRYGGYYTHYFSNDDNPEYHRRVTGPQIYKNAGDAIDAIVIGVGSGGTITGVAEYIKAWNSMVRIVAVEPAECAAISGGFIGQHGISGIGPGFVPENYNPYVVDTVLTVTTADAERAAREVLFFDGVPACTSAGATLAAAVQLLGMGKAKRPLCVFAGRHIYG